MSNNFWRNSPQIVDIERAKESFIRDFRYVKDMGYIRSHRSHNTGIGKTFEDVMRIQENNLKIADLIYKWINPDYWHKKFKSNPGDVEWAKHMLHTAGF